MVVRSTNLLKLLTVDDCCAETLHGLIKQHVVPGSTIYTDAWKGYSNIDQFCYRHLIAEHKSSFERIYGDSVSGGGRPRKFTANSVAGAWMQVKRHFRAVNGTSISYFESHLCEIKFRTWTKSDTLFRRSIYYVMCIPSTKLQVFRRRRRFSTLETIIHNHTDQMSLFTDAIRAATRKKPRQERLLKERQATFTKV